MAKRTYNKQKFSQVMLNIDTKKLLKQLKSLVARQLHIDMTEVSYNKVIVYLINNLSSKRIEYTLGKRIAYAYPLKETKIKNVKASSVVKFQKQKRLEFTLES